MFQYTPHWCSKSSTNATIHQMSTKQSHGLSTFPTSLTSLLPLVYVYWQILVVYLLDYIYFYLSRFSLHYYVFFAQWVLMFHHTLNDIKSIHQWFEACMGQHHFKTLDWRLLLRTTILITTRMLYTAVPAHWNFWVVTWHGQINFEIYFVSTNMFANRCNVSKFTPDCAIKHTVQYL